MAIDPADLDIIVQATVKATQETVRATVNGKIDAIDNKLDDHIAMVTPYIQGVSSLKIVLKMAGVVGGAILAFDQIAHIPALREFVAKL